MYKFLSLLLISIITLHADFFNSAEKAELKHQQERARLCKIFMQKAIDYKKNMRYDDLSRITLGSYKNRAKIYCAKEEPKKLQENKKVHNIENNVTEKPKYVKDISKENVRLCGIFQNKIKAYKKTMREDELAYTTLASYKKRAQIFCSEKILEKKEKSVRNEDDRLCKVFQQGPIICKKFDENSTITKEDALSKETLKSFQKHEKTFCSSIPLKKKDSKVYNEQNKLCKIFHDKIKAYEKNMREDELAYATLASYKKRAAYFCSTKKPNQETAK